MNGTVLLNCATVFEKNERNCRLKRYFFFGLETLCEFSSPSYLT